MDIVIAGGVESMTREPMFSNIREAKPSAKLTDKYEIVNQGISAERIAEKYGLSRKDIDEYSASSHEKAFKAIHEGHFKNEIIPVNVRYGRGTTRRFYC